MKKEQTVALPAVGGSSLLVIFSVLCLTVFALLSLSTVRAEQRLSDAASEAVSAYYEADLEAERIYARLRAGETVPGVTQEGERYRYACAISETQKLLVELENTKDGWKVLRWQTEALPEAISEALTVWGGE